MSIRHKYSVMLHQVADSTSRVSRQLPKPVSKTLEEALNSLSKAKKKDLSPLQQRILDQEQKYALAELQRINEYHVLQMRLQMYKDALKQYVMSLLSREPWEQ